jgi:hypothetical protein
MSTILIVWTVAYFVLLAILLNKLKPIRLFILLSVINLITTSTITVYWFRIAKDGGSQVFGSVFYFIMFLILMSITLVIQLIIKKKKS